MLTSLFIAALLLLAPLPQERTTPDDRPHPPAASAPAETRDTTARKPRQAEDLDQLLRAQEVRPILPAAGGVERPTGAIRPGVDRQLWLDGTMLFERTGRLVRREGRSVFEFPADDGSGAIRSMEIERNQWLEAMEREAEQGALDFVVTAEVTRYRGTNYIILRKVMRRVANQNITP